MRRSSAGRPVPQPAPDAGAGATARRLGLFAASSGVFLGSLDITLNVALPDIARSFSTDLQTVQWMILFYVGSSAGLQLGLGSAADVYGLRRFFIVGLAVYTAAVLLIGLAPQLPMLFGLRVLQAVGNALLMACAPALVTGLYPANERGRALGTMAGLGTLGMLLGSVAGGGLVDALGWRAVFLARVPLGLAALALAAYALRERTSDEPRHAFDFWGAASMFTGTASYVLALALGGSLGWKSPIVAALALACGVSLAAFGFAERRAARPVLDLRLLRHRVLAPAFVSAFLISVSAFVNWFILPFFVSDVMGENAQTWGLLMMLMPLTITVSAPVGGWLSDRVPPAYLTTVAALMTAATVFSYVGLDASTGVLDIAIRSAAMGLSMGLHQAANANLVMGSVPPNRLGTGGAIMTLSRSLGAVSSVALLSALVAAREAWHTGALTGAEAAGERAFVLAFGDTYLAAALLGLAAAAVSVTFWPPFVRSRLSSGPA